MKIRRTELIKLNTELKYVVDALICGKVVQRQDEDSTWVRVYAVDPTLDATDYKIS